MNYLGFSKRVSLITCSVITYGTNLLHYASYDVCFSHVYSYFLFNLFLFYLCWYEERNALKTRLVKILRLTRAIPIIMIGFMTLFPQLLYWHTATGYWLTYSYGNEPFYWLAPQIGNFF